MTATLREAFCLPEGQEDQGVLQALDFYRALRMTQSGVSTTWVAPRRWSSWILEKMLSFLKSLSVKNNIVKMGRGAVHVNPVKG
jgi:hypothetical protein